MLHHLAFSIYILNRNYLELFIAIKKYKRNLSIWDLRNRPQLDKFMREFSRLLHNYILSTYSLVEHTQNLRKKLNQAELDREFSLKVKALSNYECVKFVKKLRHYFQHFNLPLVTATLSFEKKNKGNGGVIRQRVLLDKEELLKWNKWKGSRNYIISKKEIDMEPILSEYQILIGNFYKWFYAKIEKLYSKELKELGELEKELAKLSQ